MRTLCCWLLVLGSHMVAGCGIIRLYPPVAFVERVAPIYPDARPQNCTLEVLNAPPSRPYIVFAQIVSYAGSAEMGDRMQSLIKDNACEVGADAIVLLPMQEQAHVNTVNTYPDWVLERGFGQGGRFPHWVDKRYSVSQRGFALVFKKEPVAKQAKPES